MNNSIYKIFFFLVFAVSVFFIPNNIFSQEKNAASVDKMERGATVKQERHNENSESFNSPQFFNRAEKKPRPEWIKALHEARLRGDEKLMRELEAQHSTSKNVGENVGEFVTGSSGTVGHPGEPKLEGSSVGSLQEWGTDIHVRSSNTDFRESHPAMATSSDGTIYIVWENFGSTSLPYAYLQIYYSTDGGINWNSYGYISNPSFDLSQPSLAIGEGTENYLVLAWVVDDSVPHIEVGYTPLIDVGYSLTQITPAYLTFWAGYQKPVVWTDSYDWSGWYIYLTAEAEYSTGSNNFNVVFWRSTDYGVSFSDPHETLYGNFDSFAWLDPDGTYGCVGNDLYIAVFNATDSLLYVISSLDYGANWGTESSIHMVDPLPSHAVDPDIEAATVLDNIMLCCTKSSASNGDDIAQCYSTDAGATWSTFWTMEGMTSANEWAVELTANEGGNSWHVAYNDQDHWLSYNTRPQDLSAYWQLSPEVVNDVPWATAVYTKKAITSNWTTDDPGIAWSDYRDGPGDYDIYYDNNAGPPPVPIIIVNPSSLDFGDVTSGSSSMMIFTIENSGTADLEVTNITSSDPAFTVNLTSATIAPSNQQDVEVTFSPAASMTYNGTISITHNAAGSPSPVTVTGNGVPTPVPVINIYPNTLPFGSVTVSSSSMLIFTIENTGTANLEVTNITSNQPAYTVNMTSATITPGNDQNVEVTFSPTGVQMYYGLIEITHNASGSPSTVTVTGEGIPVVGIDDELFSQIPTVYKLLQNYPNPFNPMTSLIFGLPEAGNVKITLYSIVGEEITTLDEGYKNAGYHRIEFNAKNLPSGVYFYKLQAADFIETKKMLLLR